VCSAVRYKRIALPTKGLFVWAVAGWLCRESCCAEKAAVQGKLLSQISLFGDLAGCLAVC
jgi:hypothetical protein